MKNADRFLQDMQRENPAVLDLVGAIAFAMQATSLVREMTWFGQVGNQGVFYSNSSESRYFPDKTPEEVAKELALELI